jgi:uncharacterized protein YdeI (BOF family)
MFSKRLIVTLAAAAAITPVVAFAHHGWTGQEDKTTVLEGPIQTVSYRDPHGEIEMTAGGKKWLVTLAPISRMQARGLTEANLKPGQTVWISGKRNVDTSRNEIKAENIRIGGKTTNLLR